MSTIGIHVDDVRDVQVLRSACRMAIEVNETVPGASKYLEAKLARNRRVLNAIMGQLDVVIAGRKLPEGCPTCVQLGSRPGCEAGCRRELMGFAADMECTLRQNDAKGGWVRMPVDQLLTRLKQEVVELEGAWVLAKVRRNDQCSGLLHALRKECCDVANFAMMVWDNVARLARYARETKRDKLGQELADALDEAADASFEDNAAGNVA